MQIYGPQGGGYALLGKAGGEVLSLVVRLLVSTVVLSYWGEGRRGLLNS